MTVLYTTHYMEEAAELSDHIAIMDQGRIIASGTHAELVQLVGEQTRIDLALNAEAGRVLPALDAVDGVSRIEATDGTVTVMVDDSNRVLPRLFEPPPGGARDHFGEYPGAEPGDRVPASDRQGLARLRQVPTMKIIDIALKDLVRSFRSAVCRGHDAGGAAADYRADLLCLWRHAAAAT